MLEMEKKIRSVCSSLCVPAQTNKIVEYMLKGRFSCAPMEYVIVSPFAYGMFEACGVMQAGGNLTMEMVEWPYPDKTMLAIRALAREFEIIFSAVGYESFAVHRQFVQSSFVDCLYPDSRIMRVDLKPAVIQPGAINLPLVVDIENFVDITIHATLYMLCLLYTSQLPLSCFYASNFELGLGINGLAEWLAQRSYPYEPNNELAHWLNAFKLSTESEIVHDFCARNKWKVPKIMRGIYSQPSSTSVGIEARIPKIVESRLRKAGVASALTSTIYTAFEQLTMFNYIQGFIDGHIRNNIFVGEIPNSTLDILYDKIKMSDLKEVSLVEGY